MEHEFPTLQRELADADRSTAKTAIGVSVVALVYIAAQLFILALPQLGIPLSVIGGVIALGVLVWGFRIWSTAGRVAGHVNLGHVHTPAEFALLDAELQEERETWGAFSFTKSFLLGPGFFPVPIERIAWAYRHVVKDRHGIEKKSQMWVFLRTGDRETFDAVAEDIEPAFDCLRERCPRVRIGYDEYTLNSWKTEPEATMNRVYAESGRS
ncbi:MAG: hypothetical protein AB8H86_03175 [Polyangiales bacterium]